MKNPIYFLLVVILAGTSCLRAQNNGDIIKTDPVVFPAYADAKVSRYSTQAEYESAVSDKSVSIQKLTYWSDGLKVIAYLAKPATTGNKKYPVIIFNRGSLIRNDIAYAHVTLFKKLVNNGFIVIAPALRGSEGGEGKDEFIGRELQDILNIRPMLSSFNYADDKNVFMLGESRGGIMTYKAIKEGFVLSAAATVGAITDMGKYLADNTREEEFLRKGVPEYAADPQKFLEPRSVLKWGDFINTPVLILQGAADPQVKPYHSLDLASALAKQGKTYQLIVFEGGNHILSDALTPERDDQVIKWFKKYIK